MAVGQPYLKVATTNSDDIRRRYDLVIGKRPKARRDGTFSELCQCRHRRAEKAGGKHGRHSMKTPRHRCPQRTARGLAYLRPRDDKESIAEFGFAERLGVNITRARRATDRDHAMDRPLLWYF